MGDEVQVSNWLERRGLNRQLSMRMDEKAPSKLSVFRHRVEQVFSIPNLIYGPPAQTGQQVRDGTRYNLTASPTLGYCKGQRLDEFIILHRGQEGLFKQTARKETPDFIKFLRALLLVCGPFVAITLPIAHGIAGLVLAPIVLATILGAQAFIEKLSTSIESRGRRFESVEPHERLSALTDCEKLTRAGVRFVRPRLEREPTHQVVRFYNGTCVHVARFDGYWYVLEDGYFESTLQRFKQDSFRRYVGQELPGTYERLIDEPDTA